MQYCFFVYFLLVLVFLDYDSAMTTGRDLMDARLLSLLASNDVSTATMDTMANAGLKHFSVFAHLASTRDSLCEKLSKPPLGLKDDDFVA